MFTATLTGVQCVSLKAVLENHPPKNLASLKVMDLIRKSYQKIEKVAEEVFVLQDEINAEIRQRQELYKKAETDEAKAACEKEADVAVKPLLDQRKVLNEKEYEVDFSDEQIDFLRANFKSSIADNFNRIKDALDIGDVLGVSYEEEKKEEKK